MFFANISTAVIVISYDITLKGKRISVQLLEMTLGVRIIIEVLCIIARKKFITRVAETEQSSATWRSNQVHLNCYLSYQQHFSQPSFNFS